MSKPIEILVALGAALFLAPPPTVAPAADDAVEVVRRLPPGSSYDRWEIANPNVKRKTTDYRQIRYHQGDVVTIESAAGCVQTGGSGRTWKRYVDPTGSNADRFYHGLIRPPKGSGAGLKHSPTVPQMMRIADFLAAQRSGLKFRVVDAKDDSAEPLYLVLGYEDDDYSDNGYWSHDDGTDDQCKGIGNAIVRIRIDHAQTSGTGAARIKP